MVELFNSVNPRAAQAPKCTLCSRFYTFSPSLPINIRGSKWGAPGTCGLLAETSLVVCRAPVPGRLATKTAMYRGTGPALDALMRQKRALRSLVRKQLRSFPPDVRQQEDDAIQKNILAADWFKNSQRVCAYVSCANLREVDTSHIMAHLLELQRQDSERKVYVPRVEDKESHMRMLHITNSDDDMVANSMNILEPSPLDPSGNPRKDVMQTSEPLDLLLLPGLAFDSAGRRLGRGGGYYDLFLTNYLLLAKDKGWKPPLLVALTYSVQIQEDAVPVDASDVPVDALVSYRGVLPITPFAHQRILQTS